MEYKMGRDRNSTVKQDRE